MTDNATQAAATPEPGPGAALQEERRRQSLSLTDVARQLKLAPRQVEALERDDFAALPGPVFVRGFLRNYARLLGLDPEPMVRTAERLGWPTAAVHHESFGDHSAGAPFTAMLARSRIEVQVAPDQSLLEAIEGAGVEAPYLCRGGACGQCMTKVIAGEPDHRDDVLTPEERASGELIMTCVSRAKTPRLVLDL